MAPQTRTMTGTSTRVALRTQVMIFQLLGMNRVSVDDRGLDCIIEDCVPTSDLSAIYIVGRKGDEIHASWAVKFDYAEHKRRMTLEGGGLPPRLAGIEAERWSRSGNGYSMAWDEHDDEQFCPVWHRAIEWFCKLVRDDGLELDWAVSFRRRADELSRKYGLVVDNSIDYTAGERHDLFANTILPELTATVSFSRKQWPE